MSSGGRPIGVVLEPLAARYASWLGLPAARTADTGDELEPWAMPVVLRIERDSPPSRTALLEAAASAAVAVCLDDRSAPEGEWHVTVSSWIRGRIRKVSRRARGAHWEAVGELPGVTVEHDGAQVRALLPGPVAALPKVVSRLQVSGTELDADAPGPPPGGAPLVWLAPDPPLTVGKAAAQVGHATMLLAALMVADGRSADLTAWSAAGCPCAVRTASADWWTRIRPGAAPVADWRAYGLVAVRDAGFTEVAPGTVTAAAQWPA